MRYLSPEWIDAAAEALAEHPPSPHELRIGYAVSAADGSEEFRHSILVGPDGVTVEPGLEAADIVFHLSWDLAAAVAKGEQSAQRAFLDGRATLEGDPNRLLGLGAFWSSVQDRLVHLRPVTDY